MRTSLIYCVTRKPGINIKTGEEIERIDTRGFQFFVSKAKTEKEHEDLISDFENFLFENGFNSYGFGSGSWEDCIRRNDTINFSFLDIPIKDMEEKEEVRELYREWKKKRKGA